MVKHDTLHRRIMNMMSWDETFVLEYKLSSLYEAIVSVVSSFLLLYVRLQFLGPSTYVMTCRLEPLS